ncbi:hypothetical protein [Caulobacter mirabilis]|uniref:Uncharacterized protein n=1 Tax=Caulobacter mirabilis TaxID=69666 RepID=A0A2D2B087_9CAUL|nr:hypothetical protein [Caulobacter mirabilis]ATQ43653.1 hypothetical protein CSW64_15255 [Caulobacter mirabilis]
MTDTVSARRPNHVRLLLAAGGMTAGGFAGFLSIRAADLGAFEAAVFEPSELASLFIALVLVATGLFVLAMSLSRKVAARAFDPDGDGRVLPGMMSFYRLQAALQLLAGILLALPVLAIRLFPAGVQTPAVATMVMVTALFLIQTVANLTVWRRADEMTRRMIADAAVASFWVLSSALFLWAAAEKLGLAPALSSWDALTVMMAVYLLISSTLAVRRGFA